MRTSATLWILLPLLAVPLVELYVFGLVGGEIGLGPALLLTILTAVLGLALVRRQGRDLLIRVQRQAAEDQPILGEMLEGVLLALAGICLFLPGFVTDTLGAALLLPPVRQMLVSAGIGRTVSQMARYRTRKAPDGGVIIDSRDYTVEDEEDRDRR